MKYLIGFQIEADDFGKAKKKFQDVRFKADFTEEIDGIVADEDPERKIDGALADDALNLLGSIIDLLTEIQDDKVATAIVPLLNEVFYQLSDAGLEMESCSPGLKEGK